MAFVAAPGIVMVEVRAILDGQKIENRVMIDTLTTVTPTLVSDVTNIVSVWADGVYLDRLPTAVSLREIVGTDLSEQNGAQETIALEGPPTGVITGEPMPNEVTLCVSLKTASRGRSARGRIYALALPDSVVTGNYITSSHADYLRSGFEELRTRIITAGWRWVVVSYRANNAPRPGGPVYFPITAVVVTDLLVDSMRRRKPGVGQ